MKNIILASTSPRRKELLTRIGLKFKTVSSGYKEDMNSKLPPLRLAKFLSKRKAEAVAKHYKKHIIIAADTFITLKDELLGKPHTAKEAKHMLKKINGKPLSVISGFTIIDTKSGKYLSKAAETKVYIKNLSDSEIDNYVKTKEPLDKAGAFAIQGLGAVIVKKIKGDYFNVMGLPLYDLAEALKKFGIHVL